LGIVALVVLILGGLAWTFFRKSSDRTRLLAFVLLFVGGGTCVAAVLQAAKHLEVTQQPRAQEVDSVDPVDSALATPPPPLRSVHTVGEDGLVSCGPGFAVVGLSFELESFKIVCRRVVPLASDGLVRTWTDTGDGKTERHDMHACPDDGYLQGLFKPSNIFQCAKIPNQPLPPPDDVIPENKAARYDSVPICPERKDWFGVLVGTHVRERKLLCRYFRR